MSQFDVFFFDLDGTLVDTAPDLAYALNQVLEQEGRAPLAYESIRAVASHGSAGLLGLAFGITADNPEFDVLQKRFVQIYHNNLTRESRLFEGMQRVIDKLDEIGKKWGVITNKPTFLTEPLMAGLNLKQRAACIVSGDTTEQSKPHPAPMLHACKLINMQPAQCVYIGDAERDIVAGRDADMHTIVACYGYLSDDDRPENWQADAMINQPEELLQWL
ncbi:HAD-IA family hydrolase [Methylophaga sp.]|uniref:HAD family hydrolase n=1 Tax=Methylophaga sp. TaxID=2024840 RepID=UPI0014008AB0|nr:HAD-IA family hydrolase [Methylophaga sp.]MTI64241.1 HAD-IA family hydrolase [Methylophaga sp.]